MARDNYDTVWAAEPHTLAKHELLRRYLGGWFPIMTSYHQRVIYLDGYCGPGTYEDGEPGSPLIALRTLLDHSYGKNMSGKQFLFLFNDDNEERTDQLTQVLATEKASRGGNWPAHIAEPNVSCGSFDDTAQQLISMSKNAGRRLAPIFAFVDPFGWTGLPIATLRDLLQDPGCELFVLFSYNAIQRWTSFEGTRHSLTELFGTTEFEQAPLGSGRKEFLRDLYARQIRNLCNFPYVLDFEMVNAKNRTSYFLFYGTRHVRGLELMKEAMWKVDADNGRMFSDLTADLDTLFDPSTFHAQNLQDLIMRRFAGTTVSAREIKHFVLVDTDYPPSMMRKHGLIPLQAAERITCDGQSRAGTFPDRVKIAFPPLK
ncbi:three-Cys-motif partner protein TcmP [Mycolicibacterium iranicum]|uniref:three-Cys-motif partner protein TcmP n=1 Tax=Mycolicibacterium iranicum TaxID=912594 RepID=UPI000465F805|nr:three-Cys-motif partner protein TcmP [Mycolicibacterium iranicum]